MDIQVDVDLGNIHSMELKHAIEKVQKLLDEESQTWWSGDSTRSLDSICEYCNRLVPEKEYHFLRVNCGEFICHK
jgi:hypothetical protein